MSNFTCEKCGAAIIDSPEGYVTGCPHHPLPPKLPLCEVCKFPFTPERANQKTHQGKCFMDRARKRGGNNSSKVSLAFQRKLREAK